KPKKGDAKPWLEFMEHLIPDKKDRDETLKWCATLIARPDIRMHYSLLLISETHGVGKTTLALILSRCIGLANCSFPSMAQVAERFTTWRLFKRLAVIAEMYEDHTAKTYDALKGVISDELIDAREMYQSSFTVTNYLHIIASSNYFKALKINDADRRWLVPGVTERKKEREYWAWLYDEWLPDGGFEIIVWWAHEYVKQHGHVPSGQHAPDTAAKRRSIKAGMSEGEQIVVDLGERLKELKEPRLMRLDKIRLWLASKKAQASSAQFGNDGKLF